MSSSKSRETIGIGTGLVYLFNINVGTGVLALPYVFNRAGWVLSATILTTICIVSYTTFTFVIESMAIANAVIKLDAKQFPPRRGELPPSIPDEDEEGEDEIDFDDDGSLITVSEVEPITPSQRPHYGSRGSIDSLAIYEITETAELGRMAKIFFNKQGIIFFYISMCLYLYGDLSIYCAVISKTLRDVACTHPAPNCSVQLTGDDPCWQSLGISRTMSYRLFVLAVVAVLGPFTYFNLQKTKFLQIFTSSFRVTALLTMIILTSIGLAKGNGEGRPSIANVDALPSFFGVAVYSFISHQALPSIVTPIKNKRYLYSLSFIDFLFVLFFYLLLSFTAVFTFRQINDVYSLNFQKMSCVSASVSEIPEIPFFQYILPLYPLFTISTNFPINAVTLRNNLRSVVTSSSESFHSSYWFQKIVFPSLALLPPALIAFTTTDVQFLVGFVGNYTGILVQCVIPVLLILSARKHVKNICDTNSYFKQSLSVPNKYISPLAHKAVIYFVLIWAVICLVLVTIAMAS